MRIADIAKQHGVTEQAVRNRIIRAGYRLEDLRQPGSNSLTEEGEKIVEELFQKKPQKKKKQAGGEKKQTLIEVKAERDEYKHRAETADLIASERLATIQLLRDELKQKDEQIRTLTAAVAARIAEPLPAEKKPGIFRRMFKKKRS